MEPISVCKRICAAYKQDTKSCHTEWERTERSKQANTSWLFRERDAPVMQLACNCYRNGECPSGKCRTTGSGAANDAVQSYAAESAVPPSVDCGASQDEGEEKSLILAPPTVEYPAAALFTAVSLVRRKKGVIIGIDKASVLHDQQQGFRGQANQRRRHGPLGR